MFGRLLQHMVLNPGFRRSLSPSLNPSNFRTQPLVLPSRAPATPLPLHWLVGPLQLRIPELVSDRRPGPILRAQACLPTNMAPNEKRPLPDGVVAKQGKATKRRSLTPEIEIRLTIQMAAKDGDIHTALAAYERAKEQGIKLVMDTYASLLFLCSGGDSWEASLEQSKRPEIIANPESISEKSSCLECAAPPDVAARGREVLDDMAAAGLKPSEICFTALARMAALNDDPDEALRLAQRVVEAEHLLPRLRCFTPALVAFAERGDGKGAFRVANHIADAGIELGEAEYGRLLQAAAGKGASWDQVVDVLQRMSNELAALQPITIERARLYFTSKAVNHRTDTETNGTVQRSWKVEACTVSDVGGCNPCPGQLVALDLSDAEYEEFKAGIAVLAARQERQPSDFQAFMEWLRVHGPFGVVIDAANVAFYGQNFDSGGFNFTQVDAVVERVKQEYPDLRPLVILHVNRTHAPPAKTAVGKALLSRLQEAEQFFAAPQGSNDDWYWLYAAVSAGPKGLLVSNDEMRDHLFHMLAPRFFNKWKQRHQLRYHFSGAPDTLELQKPAPFTVCTQQIENGAWIFPCVDGTWVAAVPVLNDVAAEGVAEATAVI